MLGGDAVGLVGWLVSRLVGWLVVTASIGHWRYMGQQKQKKGKYRVASTGANPLGNTVCWVGGRAVSMLGGGQGGQYAGWGAGRPVYCVRGKVVSNCGTLCRRLIVCA